MLRTTGLRDALDAATTIQRANFAKSAMSQTTLSLDVVSTRYVLQIYYMVNVVHVHYTAFDQSKVRTSNMRAGSQSDCELNGRKQVPQCESGI